LSTIAQPADDGVTEVTQDDRYAAVRMLRIHRRDLQEDAEFFSAARSLAAWLAAGKDRYGALNLLADLQYDAEGWAALLRDAEQVADFISGAAR